MSEFKIDKNVPIPEGRWGKRRKKYPFDEMEVGDSFFIHGGKQESITSIMRHWREKLGHKYTTRSVVENGVKGVRVWRIE